MTRLGTFAKLSVIPNDGAEVFVGKVLTDPEAVYLAVYKRHKREGANPDVMIRLSNKQARMLSKVIIEHAEDIEKDDEDSGS